MFARRSFTLLSLLAAGLVAACQDPAAPRAPDGAVQASQSGRAVRGSWRFNSEKYRDTGSRPSTGRSGSAALQVEALGSAGLTLLRVESFRADDLSRPAGVLERVQVKVLTTAGKVWSVRSYDGLNAGALFTVALTGLPTGATIQVTGLVRGLDGRRTDVVTVGGVAIARAPDLAVTGIALPSQVYTGVPTLITATVAELNGERGARADCRLDVDGQLADRARGIWVDAGDVVSCAFTVTFTQAGSHAVTVSLESVQPADLASANDRRSATFTAIAPTPTPSTLALSWGASVRWGTVATRDTFHLTMTAADGSLFFEGINANRSDGVRQEAMLAAVVGTALTFPLTRIELGQASGGALLHRTAYDGVVAGSGGSVGVECATRGLGTGVEFYICANSLGFTSLTYRRSAGSVTYQSMAFSQFWNGAGYDVDTYVDNFTDASPAAVIPFGSSYTFEIRVTTAGQTYGFDAVVPLGPVTDVTTDPFTCNSFTITLASAPYAARACSGMSDSFIGIAGSANGAGFLGNAPAGLRVTP